MGEAKERRAIMMKIDQRLPLERHARFRRFCDGLCA
jgi:hypothetical protein